MEVPAKAKTSTAEIEDTLIAKRDALKESVENLARELEELKQTKADMPVSPVATVPVEPQPTAQPEPIVVTGKELGTFLIPKRARRRYC